MDASRQSGHSSSVALSGVRPAPARPSCFPNPDPVTNTPSLEAIRTSCPEMGSEEAPPRDAEDADRAREEAESDSGVGSRRDDEASGGGEAAVGQESDAEGTYTSGGGKEFPDQGPLLGNRGAALWNACPLCRRPCDDPRVLACLHHFCSACLRRLLLPQLSLPTSGEDEEEGVVEELLLEAEEAEDGEVAAPATPLTPAESFATDGSAAAVVEVATTRAHAPSLTSEFAGRTEGPSPISRGPPSLRSWASFKGAWSPRGSRRKTPEQRRESPEAAADDASTTASGAKTREASHRRQQQHSLSLAASSPPSSPPPPRRQSQRGGSLRALQPPPWRKRLPSAPDAPEGLILLLRCPTCDAETEVATPPGIRRGSISPSAASAAVAAAVATLPQHAVLLHKMQGRKGPASARAKCDLCSMEATYRCAECALALCVLCADSHRRQRGTLSHSLAALAGGGAGGLAVTQGPRVPTCPLHPNNAQRLFCGPCGKLACRACPCALPSANHRCEPLAHAARNWAGPAVRAALEKARPHAAKACAALEALQRMEERVQVRGAQVEEEIECFVDSWIRSLEEHRRVLHAEARRARDSKLEALRSRRAGVERQAEGFSTAVRFADDLLAEGTDAELLGVAGTLVRRLEWCRASAETAGRLQHSALPWSTAAATEDAHGVSLQFLPAEKAGAINGHEMLGVVTAQTVCPGRCRVSSDGLVNCRQHRKTEVVVVAKDADDQQIGHGGEQVSAELRYRDASHRQLPVHVSDRKDGSYILTFTPDAAGVLSLAVTIQGKHIQGSPFTVHARTIRAHTGMFHCCTFCSSHGNKEATCACGGKMPGGYKGCGHGHAGHPGRRHWSCCGNILEGSECGRANGVFTYTI